MYSFKTKLHQGQLHFTLCHLHSTEGVEQVRVVPDAGTEASTLMLTRLDEVGDLLTVHPGELIHQVHDCQAPVDPTHPQVL